jgi:hypothetical protein
MKYTVVTLLTVILASLHSKAQDAPSTFRQEEQGNYYNRDGMASAIKLPPKHCKATREGAYGMITGGAFVVAGGIMVLASENNSRNLQTGLVGVAFIAGGAVSAVIGSLEYLGGRIYEAHHKNRFSLIGTGNQAGIAFNF